MCVLLSLAVKYHSSHFDQRFTDFIEIYQNIFKNINVQAYAQNIRQKIFELFYILLTTEIAYKAVQEKGGEIVKGLLAAMESERDPRCLLACLRNLAQAVSVFQTSIDDDIATSLYENTVCYFPITFVPPEDDPFGITSEMLIRALEDCLVLVELQRIRI